MSAAFQISAPTALYVKKGASGMRAIPAGKEIAVRRSGTNLLQKTTFPPCFAKKRSARSRSSVEMRATLP